ncbi:MAG: hypothetical protein HYY35_06405 [Deltaproteobacteria bacterium]|nr:hypothetical protein [Deltaproteobacteria bacterium]
MIEIIAAALAAFALAFTLLSLRRARDRAAALESDLDASQNHNRALIEQRDALKSSLAETAAGLEATKQRLEGVEAEKQDLERQRAALAETASRLEKARSELEAELGKLRREHESLEHRVVDFQGQWSHQLSTLEAEISTLIRQLGEFRKGTTLPIPRPEGPGSAAAAELGGVPPSGGPRLAGARPRPVSPEAQSPPGDPAAARRLP